MGEDSNKQRWRQLVSKFGVRSMNQSGGVRVDLMGSLLLLLALAAFPLVAPLLGLEYYIGFVRRVLIVMMAATSLNFIVGYGGMAALGHAGFIGVGAYTVAVLVESGVHSAWVAWGAAFVVSGLFAAAIGAVSLRTRGVYFLMITLAFAQMLYYLAVSLRRFGGDDGYVLQAPLELGTWLGSAQGDTFYWIVLVLVGLLFVFFTRVTASRFGHALMGIRDNETRMEALGYEVARLKLAAFAGAGAIAGLSGALLACNNKFVGPSMMHWTESATLLVIVVLGGLGRRWGAVFGVAIWLTLAEVLKLYTDYWHWILGLLLIAAVFLSPRGIAALLDSRRGDAVGATR